MRRNFLTLTVLATLVIPAVFLAAPDASASIITPSFHIFPAPATSTFTAAGEPSVGVNWNTGAVMFQALAHTARVTFNLTATPPTATWTHTSGVGIPNLDPILYTDPISGVTIAGGLHGPCSILERTTNDGAAWSQVLNSCSGTYDHQTIGGGAWHSPAPLGATTNRSVYYCAQGNVVAACSTSWDGGTTFLAPTLLGCGGLHGHVKVAPNGTAYVPHRSCGGRPGVSVSTNNGLTWSARTVPFASGPGFDPSVAIGKDNRVYLAYTNNTGASTVAVSDNEGLTWKNIRNVGASLGVVTSTFHSMVAGDNDRAAVAFLGTTTSGNAFASSFGGEWHLYVAYTYNGGDTWTTIDLTPSDPVQRGWICSAGISCGAGRNLLDFMDAAIDSKGRVVVGFADGCVSPCTAGSGSSTRSWGTIAYQTGGSPLFAAHDPAGGGGATAPSAPTLSATAGNATVNLSWTTPADGGAVITGYKLYRGTTSGSLSLYQTLGVVNAYSDTSVTNGVTYYYAVSAVNSVGEGAASNEVNATPVASPPPPPPISPPSAPQNLTATVTGQPIPVTGLPIVSRGVQLSWQAPATGPVTHYTVYRDSGSGFVLFRTTASLSTLDNTVTPGQTYSYKVSASNSGGEGPASNTVTVTP